MATARCFSGIVTDSMMAFSLNGTSQRQGGRIFDKGNQTTAHATGCPCDNDVDHR
jgi:hypothetical protein